MKAKLVFIILINFVCILNLIAKDIDTLAFADSIQTENNIIPLGDTLINQNFGPEYEKILNKAEWAYHFGLFNVAVKQYRKAAEINPKSLYIQYKIKEIEYTKHNIGSLVLYFNFDKPDILIKSLIFFIVYFVFSLLVILLIILVNRGILEHNSKIKESLLEKYQQLLVDYLFSEDENKDILIKIKNTAASSFNRKILIDQMIDLSINLTGEAKEKLQNLFILLKLDNDSIRKAYSRYGM